MRIRSLIGVIFLVTFFTAQLAAAASFQGLGDLDGGIFESKAKAVSADGATVIGQSIGASGTEAFRWTSDAGMVGLGELAGGASSSNSYGVSSNGSVIAGWSESVSGAEAFRWTSGAGMVGLGDLAGGGFLSQANALSSDGTTIVGHSQSASGTEAFRWTSGAGMVGLGDLTGGSFQSQANGVSSDGSTIVGNSSSASGTEAFAWTSGGGMVGLGDLAGGSFASFAMAASSDGAVVIGYGNSASGIEAFRWTSGGGMIGLDDLAGGSFDSRAYAVSSDGSVVVGQGNTATGIEAFIWDATNGMQNLRDHLTDLGLDLTGWTLTSARGISSDGKTIVGYGINPSGYTEAWIATLDSAWGAAISEMADVPLILDFKLKGYQAQASFQLKTLDLINLIADTMGEPRPPVGTRLALHTGGEHEGKAFLVDKSGAPLAAFNPIDRSIFSVSSSGVVIAPPGETPGSYKKTAWFQVSFALDFEGDTNLDLTGSAVVKTTYTGSTSKGNASAKLILSGPGQVGGTATFFLGKGKGKQKK